MKLSIVTTLYQSAAYVLEFHQRISAAAKKITTDYEIIFVNDGSKDNSFEIAKTIHVSDIHVNVIDLSRNFGHHIAIMTGLAHASGDYVFLIDCDLEEEPELLTIFWKEMIARQGADVVYGVQQKRQGNFIEKFAGKYFYKIINYLSDIKIDENVMVVRLMTRLYVKNLLKYTERELVFVGIAALTGFKQISVLVVKKDNGSTTYNFEKKLNLAINFITSLSSKPLVFIFNLGLLITLISLIGTSFLLLRRIFFGLMAPGWASIMLSIWLLGGVIIFCLGIIGMYISKIFIEVKQRPYSLIKEIHAAEITSSAADKMSCHPDGEKTCEKSSSFLD